MGPRRRVRILISGALAAALLAACAPTDGPAAPQPSGPTADRIEVRVVDGHGEFFDPATGERFVPRGMNYNAWVEARAGAGVTDDLLTVEHYDPGTVRSDFAQMQQLGFNTVRILIDTCHPSAGCAGTGPNGREVNGAYLDNLADFLGIAGEHGMVVLIGSNTLPDDSWWVNATARKATHQFEGAANEILNPESVPIYLDYWRRIVQGLVDRDAPLEYALGYELRQEQHFWRDEAPLSLTRGEVTTANGETYDMAVQEEKDRMVDEGLVYWADLLRAEIRSIDPGALVTVGFFVPNEPHPVHGAHEPRLVRTHYLLRSSALDFVDIHHYPGNGVDNAQIWENFGLAGAERMPVLLGEYGAIRDWWPDEAAGAGAVMDLEVEACRAGIDGFVFWAWRGDLNRGEYYATDGAGELAAVVAPAHRPDPCEPGEFDFLRFNAAAQATATASSHVPGFGPERAHDEGPQHWNAAGRAPQQVELTLAAPATVERIELVVAQDPPGHSTHELWVLVSGGSWQRVEVFDGVTADGDVLRWAPAIALDDVVGVRVVTTALADLDPAWREIYVYAVGTPG